MEKGRVEKYSPHWLGNQIHNGYEFLFKKALHFFETTSWIHLINLGLFVGFLALSFFSQKNQNFLFTDMPLAGNFVTSRYTESFPVIMLLCAFGTAAFYLKPTSLPSFSVIGFIIGICGLYLFNDGRYYAGRVALTANMTICFGIFLSFYWLRTRYSTRILKWDYLIAAYLGLIGMYAANSYFGRFVPWYFETSRLLLIFSLLTMEYQARRNASAGQEFCYIFSAMNILTPIPVEVKDRRYDDKWNTRLRGLFDIGIGVVFLVIAVKVKKVFLNFPENIEVSSLLFYGFMNYLYYFFASFSWIALPVGIGRWYGMTLPDFFDLPLLACSPADRWRRWNTYYYNWFYKVLFFPVFKKTKSLALAILVVTIGTLIVHSGSLNFGYFLWDQESLRARAVVLLLLFFSLHGILIYVSIKWPRLWLSEDSKKGWISLFWMLFLMSIVHIIAPK